MKYNSKALTYAMVIAHVVLSLVVQDAIGQESILVVENQETHRQKVIGCIGKNLRYKSFASNHFKQGRISAITDSTISVESDVPGLVITIRHQDLSAVKYSKGPAMIVIGTATMVGAIALAVSGINQQIHNNPIPILGQGVTEAEESVRAGTIILSVPTFILGVAFVSPRKIRLGNSWVIKTKHLAVH